MMAQFCYQASFMNFYFPLYSFHKCIMRRFLSSNQKGRKEGTFPLRLMTCLQFVKERYRLAYTSVFIEAVPGQTDERLNKLLSKEHLQYAALSRAMQAFHSPMLMRISFTEVLGFLVSLVEYKDTKGLVMRAA